MVGLALALDGEDVVHQGHPDVFRIHAWQGELDDVGPVLDPPLRGGEPRRGPLKGLFGEEPPNRSKSWWKWNCRVGDQRSIVSIANLVSLAAP